MSPRRGNQEGSIRWRPRESRWRGEILLDGKRQYFYGDTRAAVLEKFAKAKELQRAGLPVSAGKESLSKFLERWLEDCVKPRNRARTYLLYKQQITHHIV